MLWCPRGFTFDFCKNNTTVIVPEDKQSINNKTWYIKHAPLKVENPHYTNTNLNKLIQIRTKHNTIFETLYVGNAHKTQLCTQPINHCVKTKSFRGNKKNPPEQNQTKSHHQPTVIVTKNLLYQAVSQYGWRWAYSK